MPSISCSDLSLRWDDGTAVLDGVDLALGPGRAGLIGSNGSGKTTLLRLLAGEIEPTGGTVRVDGSVGYLPQHLPLEARRRVDEVLGIAPVRAALRAVEAGAVDEAQLARIGEDWDIEERARATLDRLGLRGVDLDRTVATLSGGETILLGCAARVLARPGVLLLDEPTNNLDRARRRFLYDAVEAHRGVLVVVSHDRELLDRVDRVIELRDGRVRVYGGGFGRYEAQVAEEQAAAAQAVRTAAADVRRQRSERAEAQTRLARRARSGRTAQAEHRLPRIVAGARQRKAQESAGKHAGLHAERLAEAEARLAELEDAVRDPDEVRIDLPDTAVPPRRAVLTCAGVNATVRAAPSGEPTLLWARPVNLAVRGPERLALLGPNGGGKTTLLRVVAGARRAARGGVSVGVAGVGYLPQRLDVLDPDRSVLDNLRARAPGADEHTLRARLARFGFRGVLAEQPAGTLSGGERFRAVLASLLGAAPPPQLLLLDEPTNNLDLHSVAQLEEALAAYRGALVVATHDLPFAERIGIDRWLHLDRVGLTETAPPT